MSSSIAAPSTPLFRNHNDMLRFVSENVDLQHFLCCDAVSKEVRLWANRTGRGKGFETIISLQCPTAEKAKILAKAVLSKGSLRPMSIIGIKTTTWITAGGSFPCFELHWADEEPKGVTEKFFPDIDFAYFSYVKTGKEKGSCTIVQSKSAYSKTTVDRISICFERFNATVGWNHVANLLGENENQDFPGMKFTHGRGTGKERIFELDSEGIKRIYWIGEKVKTGPLETDYHTINPERREIASSLEEIKDWLSSPAQAPAAAHSSPQSSLLLPVTVTATP